MKVVHVLIIFSIFNFSHAMDVLGDREQESAALAATTIDRLNESEKRSDASAADSINGRIENETQSAAPAAQERKWFALAKAPESRRSLGSLNNISPRSSVSAPVHPARSSADSEHPSARRAINRGAVSPRFPRAQSISTEEKLIQAIHAGNLNEVKLLLDSTNINTRLLPGDDLTLMMIAIVENQKDIFTLLFTEGADQNAVTLPTGRTALHLATIFKDRGFYVAQLLSHPHTALNVMDSDGQTPLMLAMVEDRVEIFNLLMARNADPSLIRRSDNSTVLHQAVLLNRETCVDRLLQDSRTNIDAQDSDRNTPLHIAVYHGHLSLVKKLKLKGANTVLVNKDDLTPVILAMQQNERAYKILSNPMLTE